jgi:phospholipid/cholesterol/gamma-HCH transport system permease protein
MDTAGAWLIGRLRQHLEAAGAEGSIDAFRPEHATLIAYVADESRELKSTAVPRAHRSVLTSGISVFHDMVNFLAFTGEAIVSLLRAIRHPGRIRWQEILVEIYNSGFKALPIVGLLSFLIGVVIAYQGAVQLKLYGANIYIADMIGYAMLRELAPLLTAILVCGRTGSAYAAQIGTMKIREEVAALETIGIPPMDLLVLPKLIALIIVMPLISVYADILSVFGGMIMSYVELGLSFEAFLGRLKEAITYSTFMIGIGKTPVFAAIIAIVGCYQGFKVSGSAESVGRHTTISVVQSIFFVIVTDALFSIVFSLMGV